MDQDINRWTIYMYTFPNGKRYIGATTRSLSQRRGVDWSKYKRNKILTNAIQEFASWVKSTDPEQPTGNTLAEPVTYVDGETSTTYTLDNAAYRKAKFRAELSDYVELDSTLFFYLFTELFLMVDNRAKNMFPSFIGESI